MSQSFKIKNEEDIIAASRLIVEEGMLPRRIVLRNLNDKKFVVHIETLVVQVEGPTAGGGRETVFFTHHLFENGDYFDHGDHIKVSKDAAREAAMKCYQKRSKNL